MPHKTKGVNNGGKRKKTGQRVGMKKKEVADSKNLPSGSGRKLTSGRPESEKKMKKKEVADSKNLPSGSGGKLTSGRPESEKKLKKKTVDSQNSAPRRSARLAGLRLEGSETEERNIEETEVENRRKLVICIGKKDKDIADDHLAVSIPGFSKKTREKRSECLQNVIGDAINVKRTEDTKTRKIVVHISKEDKYAADKHLEKSIPSSTISRKERKKRSDALPIITNKASVQSDIVTVATPVNLGDTASNRKATASSRSSSLSISSVKGSLENNAALLCSTPIASGPSQSRPDLKRKSPFMSPIQLSKPDQKKFKEVSQQESPKELVQEKFKWELSQESPTYESTSNSTGSNSDFDCERDSTITNTRYSTFVNSDSDRESADAMTLDSDLYRCIVAEEEEEEWNLHSAISQNTYTENKESYFESTPRTSSGDRKENPKNDRKGNELLTSTPIVSHDHLKPKKETLSPPMSPIEIANPVQNEDERKTPPSSSTDFE